MVKEKNRNAAKALRVLVVEDDRVTARVAAAICESLGYTVDIARDGVEAISHLREQVADVVFMDLQMPRMGGYEAAYEIRRMEEEAGSDPVPIIAVTGVADPTSHMRSLQVGMDDCLHKPYTIRMVQEVMARHAGQAAASDLPAESAPPYAGAALL